MQLQEPPQRVQGPGERGAGAHSVADEGGFYLSFRGVQTARLVWDMTNNQLEDGAHPGGHVDRVHRPHRGRAVAAVFFVWGHGHAGYGAVRMHE